MDGCLSTALRAWAARLAEPDAVALTTPKSEWFQSNRIYFLLLFFLAPEAEASPVTGLRARKKNMGVRVEILNAEAAHAGRLLVAAMAPATERQRCGAATRLSQSSCLLSISL